MKLNDYVELNTYYENTEAIADRFSEMQSAIDSIKVAVDSEKVDDEEFDKIKEEMNQYLRLETDPHKGRTVWFARKGKFRPYVLDTTHLSPARALARKGNSFKERYTAMLEETLFSTNPELDIDSIYPLLTMCHFFSSVGDKNMVVASRSNRIYTNVAISCLNEFFTKHKDIIFGVYKMFQETSARTMVEQINKQQTEEGVDVN